MKDIRYPNNFSKIDLSEEKEDVDDH